MRAIPVALAMTVSGATMGAASFLCDMTQPSPAELCADEYSAYIVIVGLRSFGELPPNHPLEEVGSERVGGAVFLKNAAGGLPVVGSVV